MAFSAHILYFALPFILFTLNLFDHSSLNIPLIPHYPSDKTRKLIDLIDEKFECLPLVKGQKPKTKGEVKSTI